MAITPMRTLRALVARCGSQSAAAKALNISPTYLSFLINGKMKPSGKMLKRLGFTKRVVIERTRRAQ